MIRSVLLDIDNTLLDFDGYVRQSMKTGFREFGLGEYDDSMYALFEQVNNGLWRRLEKGELSFGELLKIRWNCVFDALGICFDGRKFEEYFTNCLHDSAIPVPGAMELLNSLQGRYILGAASNGPWEQQLHRLQLGGMYGYFNHMFISERVGASKPARAFFSHCMDEMNAALRARGEQELAPGNVLMVGDSLTSDMAGAIGFGMKTCYFDRYRHGKGDDLPIDYTIHSLADMHSFL